MEIEDQEIYNCKEKNEPSQKSIDSKISENKEGMIEQNDFNVDETKEDSKKNEIHKTPYHSKSDINQQMKKGVKKNNYMGSDDSKNNNHLKKNNKYEEENYQDYNPSNMNKDDKNENHQNINSSKLDDADKKENHQNIISSKLNDGDKKENHQNIVSSELNDADQKGNHQNINPSKPLQFKNDDKTGNIQSIKLSQISNKEKEEINYTISPEQPLGNGVIDFKYEYIMQIYKTKQLDCKKEDVILLTTGSFNPIHRMHIEILNIASRFLSNKNKYNIICGLISPSADCYVRHKKPPLIPFELRCDIIKCALNEYNEENKDTIPIFLHKWEGTHNFFIDFPDVIKEIQERLLPYNTRLIYVCGMDLFLNCAHYLGKNVIAVDRKPYKNKKFKTNEKDHIYIIKDEKTEPYSSTFIRDSFINGDYENIKKVTFPKTSKKIIKFYQNNENQFYKK